MYKDRVGLRVISHHYEDIDMIKWDAELYYIDYEHKLVDSPFWGIHIGNAQLYYYDATRKHPYNLRMDANIHTRYSQFEILNSVRIFEDEYDFDSWEMDKYDLDEGKLDYTDFDLHELESLNSWTEYDEENTLNVYGRLVCLDEIKIFPEYRNKGYGTIAMEQLIQYFGRIGMDFMLLKPYPVEGNTEDNNYRMEQINRLIHFYQKVSFGLTKGKLLNDYCMVKRIND